MSVLFIGVFLGPGIAYCTKQALNKFATDINLVCILLKLSRDMPMCICACVYIHTHMHMFTCVLCTLYIIMYFLLTYIQI